MIQNAILPQISVRLAVKYAIIRGSTDHCEHCVKQEPFTGFL